VVRTKHIVCRFRGILGILDAVLIRVWSFVTWRPLRHCSMDLGEPCSQVLVEIERFWSAGGQHNTWSAGVVRTRFRRTGQIWSGGLAATGPVSACRPPRSKFGLQPVFQRSILDETLHDGHARKRNSRSSHTKDTVFSDHNRKPHTLFLREFEALCCTSDSLTTFFPEALMHEIYL